MQFVVVISHMGDLPYYNFKILNQICKSECKW